MGGESLTWTWKKSWECNSPLSYLLSLARPRPIQLHTAFWLHLYLWVFILLLSLPPTAPDLPLLSTRSSRVCVCFCGTWIIDKSIKKVWQRLMVGKYFTQTSSRFSPWSLTMHPGPVLLSSAGGNILLFFHLNVLCAGKPIPQSHTEKSLLSKKCSF